MVFQNVALGYDKKLKQWKLHVCCHTCGKVGELYCFDNEWDYDDYITMDFPCKKCFWKKEIQGVKNRTTDFEGIEENFYIEMLKEKGISWKEWGELPAKEAEKIEDLIGKKMESLSNTEARKLIQREIDHGDCDFNGEVCRT